MHRRTFLAAVPLAVAGCVTQDRSANLDDRQVAPEAKAIVDFAYDDAVETATVTLVRATGFRRGVVERVTVDGTAILPENEPVVWADATDPSGARTRLPLDDGATTTAELGSGGDVRVVAEFTDGRVVVVGRDEVPDR